jgi:hypothetical protein
MSTCSIPRGVRSRTFFLSRSPELMDESSGNFFIKRSVCVPFLTVAGGKSVLVLETKSIVRHTRLLVPQIGLCARLL